MSRYFMGINSTSFEQGCCASSGVFDKRRVAGMNAPGRVYLIADPQIIEFGHKALMVGRKRAARHALLLAEAHGGAPLVVECQPSTNRLHEAPQVKGGYYQAGSSVRVLRVYRLVRFVSLSHLDLVCILDRAPRCEAA